MGCDGGTIPKRVELVREKKKVARPDEENLTRIKWASCAHSEQPLRMPIACDHLGNLFSLESVIDGILHKSLAKRFKHIKGKKDLVLLEPSLNPTFQVNKGHAADDVSFVSQLQCPVANLEMNGKYNFVAIGSCGHVISERALKEIKGNSCIVCQREFSQTDVIPLNPSPEQLEPLKARLKERQAVAKLAKKEAKKVAAASADGSEVAKEASNPKKRKEPTAAPQSSAPPLALDVQVALKKATQTHEAMSQKSAVYRSMFGSDKKAKLDTPEHTFMISGSQRAYF